MSGWAQSLETYSTSKLDTVRGTLSRVVGAPSRLSCLLWRRCLLQRKVRWRLGEKMRRCQRSDGGRIAAPTVVVLRRYRARMKSGILHALNLSSMEAAAGIEDQLIADLDALRGRCGPEWRQPARLPCLHLSSVQLHNCQHVLSCYTNDVSLRELW